MTSTPTPDLPNLNLAPADAATVATTLKDFGPNAAWMTALRLAGLLDQGNAG